MEMAIKYFSGDAGFNCKMTMNTIGNARQRNEIITSSAQFL